MKRLFIVCALLFMMCAVQASLENEIIAMSRSITGDTWKKAKNNAWPGVVNQQTYWYKLDENGRLLWSPDGKKWEADADGMWADKEGVFYKLDGVQLKHSPDAGNTWIDTPEWKWLAVDGNWYKLDKDRTVWMQKAVVE